MSMNPAKKMIISRSKALIGGTTESVSVLNLNTIAYIKKHTQNSFIMTILFSVLFMLSSCSNSSRFNFESSEAALTFYKDYHQDLQTKKQLSSTQLLSVMEDWKEVSDTVYRFLQKDPAFFAHAGLSLDYTTLSDSIKMEFMRFAYDGNYGLKDLANLKYSGRNVVPSQDLVSTFERSSNFFEKLGRVRLAENDGLDYGFDNYIKFLERYRYSKFDASSLEKFITEEDRFFQDYLNRIDENINEDLTLITKRTEDICQRIFLSANDGMLSDTTALVYMAMRTNRRLVMNAVKCLELIQKNQVHSSEQANVYLWMLVQPFLSIDQFSATLLTNEQKQSLFVLAESYDAAMQKMIGQKYLEKDVVDVLPMRIIKLYITTL